MFMLLSKHASDLMQTYSLNMSVYAHIEVHKCLHTGSLARRHVHTHTLKHACMHTCTHARRRGLRRVTLRARQKIVLRHFKPVCGHLLDMCETFLVQKVVLKRLKYASACVGMCVCAFVCTSPRGCMRACMRAFVLRYARPRFEDVSHQRHVHAAEPENASMSTPIHMFIRMSMHTSGCVSGQTYAT